MFDVIDSGWGWLILLGLALLGLGVGSWCSRIERWLHRRRLHPGRLSERRIKAKTKREWPRLLAELNSGRTYSRRPDAYDFFTEGGM